MRKPASRPNVGGRRSTPVVTTVEVPKKTTNKGVGKAKEKEEAGGGEEPCDQSILSGSAGNRITPTLSLAKCITGTRPEYVRYYHGIGIGKKKELLVWSKCLSIRNMMANSQQVQPKNIPKWIPKQFLSVTTQVLFNWESSAKKYSFCRQQKYPKPANVWFSTPWNVSGPYELSG